MATPVNGELTIGELRQSILAVLVGNPHFTEEEQLLANHTTYECENEVQLAKWLRNVRLQDAERSKKARWQATRAVVHQAVCESKEAHLAELECMMRCQILSNHEQQLIANLMLSAGFGVGDRIRFLGLGWQQVLDNMGYIPASKGYNALKDN